MTTQTEYKKYRIYGTVGMVALFLMGGLVGFILNGSDRINHSTMSKNDCNTIAGRIIEAARNNQPDLIEQLNKVYSENCLNRVFEQPKPQPKFEEKKLPETTCAAVEELLKQRLKDENSLDPSDHLNNSDIYEKMYGQGCAENKEKWSKLSKREANIAAAIDLYGEIRVFTDEEFEKEYEKENSTCAKIEKTLRRQLSCVNIDDHYCNENDHIRDAKIYANLSERGCPENSERYKERAKQELEIARALTDDRMDGYQEQQETTEIVETYKRLQMQAEAEKIIEKAKKLTNPAIDFIIQLEKIIEED